MRVLFVDDEPKVLEGLELMLFDQAGDWDMSFKLSADEALAHLDGHGADVLVTDMRMPGIDGEALLRQVADRHPEVVRIVLSGQVEMATTERVLMMVHDYLSKPCEAKDLVATVERALALSRSARSDKLRRLAGSTTQLPPRPTTSIEIRATMNRSDFSLDDIADVLSADVAMSATILHLANSAFFARGTAAADIRDAVRRLGADLTAGAVLAAEALGSVKPPGIDVDRLSRHALQTLASVRAAVHTRDPIALEAATLHPIGRLVIAVALPEMHTAARSLAASADIEMLDAYEELLGFTDAHAGAYLMRLWKVDEDVATAIEHMDGPWDIEGPARGAAGAIWAVHRASGGRRSAREVPDPLPADLRHLVASIGKEL